ncbi:SprA family protein [Azospira oryzae]|uniref:SprA family protein n=1 Tax=Azospira oryzae TaxID=146939 RepID=A0ABY0IRP8_9RHOO|nr:putative metalloprotease CJM1_0395 family protein [Azospira oryzae]RZT90273.1 SprA family protein [Azospira oryzae]
MIGSLSASGIASVYPVATGGVAAPVQRPAAGGAQAAESGSGASSSGSGSAAASGAEWNGGYGQSLGKNPFAAAAGKSELSEDEQRQVEKLKETDRKVRAHEQAHIAAGGALVQGGASYSYHKGPDGRMYAVAGEVSIDVSPGRTPEESLAKAQQIRAAAMAPADPSPQDRRVAAGAARLESSARAEQAKEQATEAAAAQEGSGSTGGVSGEQASAPVAAEAAVAGPSGAASGGGARGEAAYRLESVGVRETAVSRSRVDLFA